MFNRLQYSFIAPLFFFATAILLSANAWGQRVHNLMPSPETVHVRNFNAALKQGSLRLTLFFAYPLRGIEKKFLRWTFFRCWSAKSCRPAWLIESHLKPYISIFMFYCNNILILTDVTR